MMEGDPGQLPVQLGAPQQEMRLHGMGLQDVRPAIVDQIAQGGENRTVKSAALGEPVHYDADLIGCLKKDVRVALPAKRHNFHLNREGRVLPAQLSILQKIFGRSGDAGRLQKSQYA